MKIRFFMLISELESTSMDVFHNAGIRTKTYYFVAISKFTQYPHPYHECEPKKT